MLDFLFHRQHRVCFELLLQKQGNLLKLLYKYRAVWITTIAWFGLITLNQIMRGYPIVPPGITTGGYITIHLVIGAFIGGIIYIIGGIAATLRDMKK